MINSKAEGTHTGTHAHTEWQTATNISWNWDKHTASMYYFLLYSAQSYLKKLWILSTNV